MNKSVRYLCVLGCIYSFSCFAQSNQNKSIALHDGKFNFIPAKFYIADVADARASRNVVVFLIDKEKNSPTPVDLTHGAVESIKNFLSRNLHRDTTLRPVLLTINEFKINETRTPQGEIEGNLKINFSFSSQLSYKNKHLVNYSSDTHYHRAINDPAVVELKLRQGIVAGIYYFHNWINTHKDR